MNKTIIHSKIPLNNEGNWLVNVEQVTRFAKLTKEQLGNDYTLIITPFETTKIDGDAMLINIDCKEYSYNELIDIVEKAQMYDGLCK